MNCSPDTKREELWSDTQTVELDLVFKSSQTRVRCRKPDWLLIAERTHSHIAVRIGYYKCDIEVEEVTVSGCDAPSPQGTEVTFAVEIWTGHEKHQCEGFNVNIHDRITYRGDLKASALVRYRRKINCDWPGCSKARPEPHFAFTWDSLISLSSHYESLLLSPIGSDVVFEVESEEIPAHKLILTTRVPHFKSLFDSGMKEAVSNRILVEDATPHAFKQILKFIYCGRIPDDVDTNADKYLPLAEKYDLDGLKTSCVESMKSGLTRENVVNRLILADLYRCPDLKKKCFAHLERTKTTRETVEPLQDYPPLMLEFIEYLLTR